MTTSTPSTTGDRAVDAQVGIEVVDRTVPGPHGPVPVREYRPAGPVVAGLAWAHGGAFQHGDLDVPEADWVSRCLAAAGVRTVSVDYRLAVGDVFFPVPSDDVLAAWTWAWHEGFRDLPPERRHLGGGSAGGNLAASVSLQVRDGAGPLPATTVLVYPVLHSVLPAPSPELAAALATSGTGERFDAARTRELNLAYVGREELLSHPYAFPAHGDLTGLPPTLVVTSDLDDLRPSGEAYAAALVAAGVEVTVVREPGVPHGHLNFPETAGAQRTVARLVAWLTAGARP
ncbi:alpha/beta hydrolase fold domain-containing protein [Kineococcus sp. TBRC 1896]|uniref:Alpha/beta hydrolase fold domain-containing protein n=1 Tax=Kineococcus mangrovi TaxID=1660183 RepID=A0ABV4I5G3_9ACTN